MQSSFLQQLHCAVSTPEYLAQRGEDHHSWGQYKAIKTNESAPQSHSG